MRRFLGIATVAVAGLLALPGCGRTPPTPPPPSPSPTPTPTPAQTPPPSPTPTPTPFVKRKPMDAGMLFNGLQYKWSVNTTPGETAARDREKDGSYRLELNLNIAVPRPATTVEDLKAANPQLPSVLPSLPLLLESARVSPDFAGLYERKMDWLKERLERLDQILSRHNYYDCDTILELRHPQTGRRALLVQGDMDVNVDGSDGDRNIEVDGSGQFFQPQTSYRWPKTTVRPNPFIAKFQERIEKASQELAQPTLADARRDELKSQVAEWKRQVADLKSASFLVSKTDPSVVLPGFMMRSGAASIGDYAVVIHGDKLYPAIVGDAGPSYKAGEASLRLCNEIKDSGTPLARPVSDLSVTYLVFPGSADPQRVAPDLDRWHARCGELLAEIGAPGAPLHRWENIVPPWPTPTPSPSPSPSPAASPQASPAPSAAPDASPALSPATNAAPPPNPPPGLSAPWNVSPGGVPTSASKSGN